MYNYSVSVLQDIFPKRKEWAKEACYVIKNKKGIFKDCIGKIEEKIYGSFYDNCLNEACRYCSSYFL